jgi:hypothetical protein
MLTDASLAAWMRWLDGVSDDYADEEQDYVPQKIHFSEVWSKMFWRVGGKVSVIFNGCAGKILYGLS